jgi:hypothetical protein
MSALSSNPTLQCTIDAEKPSFFEGMRDLFGALVQPSDPLQHGYAASRSITECNRFHVTPDAPLGPIHYSCDANALYVYTARYANGDLGVIAIVGEYARYVIESGELGRDYQGLLARTDYCGEILSHTLTQVVTPAVTSSLVESVISFENSTNLRYFFSPQVTEPGLVTTPLSILRVKLSGFPMRPAPVCTLLSSYNSSDIILTVGRSVEDPRSYAVNLTSPRPSVPLRYRS